MVIPVVQITADLLVPETDDEDESVEESVSHISGSVTSEDASEVDTASLQNIHLAYTGHVKSLVKMYEKFGNSVAGAGSKDKSTKPETPPSSKATPESQRLAILEKRMNAVIRFIGDFVETELDVLESNAKVQVETDSKVSLQQSRTNELDEELEEILTHLPYIENLISTLRKENKVLKLRMAQVENMVNSFKTLHKDVLGITDLVSKLLAQVGGLVTVERAKMDKCSSE